MGTTETSREFNERDKLAERLVPVVLQHHPDLIGFGRLASEMAYIYADGLLWARRKSPRNNTKSTT